MQVDSDEKGGITPGLLPESLDGILKGRQPFRPFFLRNEPFPEFPFQFALFRLVDPVGGCLRRLFHLPGFFPDFLLIAEYDDKGLFADAPFPDGLLVHDHHAFFGYLDMMEGVSGFQGGQGQGESPVRAGHDIVVGSVLTLNQDPGKNGAGILPVVAVGCSFLPALCKREEVKGQQKQKGQDWFAGSHGRLVDVKSRT